MNTEVKLSFTEGEMGMLVLAKLEMNLDHDPTPEETIVWIVENYLTNRVGREFYEARRKQKNSH